jgi:hypothetical protein
VSERLGEAQTFRHGEGITEPASGTPASSAGAVLLPASSASEPASGTLGSVPDGGGGAGDGGGGAAMGGATGATVTSRKSASESRSTS